MRTRGAAHGLVAALLAGLLGAAMVGLFVATGGASGTGSTPDGEALPDLDQETPSQLRVARAEDGQGYVIGFRSAVRNVGDGPLIIRARRVFPASDLLMRADQLVRRVGESTAVIEDVGRLHFVRSPDHDHWHLVGFDHYELRPLEGGGEVVRDRKSGFCLGDRFRIEGPPPPAAAPEKVYRSRCGLGLTELRGLVEGISVGYGDDYDAFLEYQDLPLQGLPDGRYLLVHRVNADRRIRELRYDNDAASLVLDLRWRSGKPSINVLARCPDDDACEAPSR